MFCYKCGNKMDDGARFCDKCGTPMKTDSPQSAVQQQPSPQPQAEPQPQQAPQVQRKIVEYQPGELIVCPKCGYYLPSDQKTCHICKSSLEGAVSASTLSKDFSVSIESPKSPVESMPAVESNTNTATTQEYTKETEPPIVSEPVAVSDSSNAPAASSTVTCPSCGAVVKPGNKFCEECGTPIG